MNPNFDFDNVETVLLKEAQKAGGSLPKLGNLGGVPGIHSKCGAAQVATAGSGGVELWQDRAAFRFDHCGGALRVPVALKQRRTDFRSGQRIGQATRFRDHPNGGVSGCGESVTISRIWRLPLTGWFRMRATALMQRGGFGAVDFR
ncbi:MAG TPA: hypothetical protein VMQ45_01565 [Burkholderiaceae bacterium]|nr:hypothetical protein [Burkholderiaceae bacterium]